MLVFDQVRGFDSTGICFVGNSNNKAKVEKELDGPENLWSYYDSELLDHRGVANTTQKVMLGHNRAATIGKVTRENAHPFTFDTVTGVHNGSLDDWYDLERDEKGHQFDVDSKALIATIARKGIDHTWKSFRGAATVVWWDEADGSLNMVRNNQRPLYLAYSKNNDVLFWASEPWMITVAASRNNITLKTFTEEKEKDGQKWTEKYTVYPMATDHFFKFSVSATGVKLVEDRKLEKKVAPISYTPTYTGWNRTNGGTTIGGTNSGKERLNNSWATGLEKAGKEHVSRIFQYEKVIQCWKNNTFAPYFIGRMVDGAQERVYVYPQTQKQYQEMLDDNMYFNNFYEITCRPRMTNDYSDKFWAFCISQDHVERTVKGKNLTFSEVADELFKKGEEQEEDDGNVVRLYKTFGHLLVEEDQWRKNMKEVGGCCAWCNNGISIEEANECEYVGGQCILCPECKSEPSVQDYLGTAV